MKKIFRRESVVVENRFFWASVVLVGMTAILILRLWFVQVYRGEYYRRISENNRIRKIEIPAPRGIILDRNGQVLLGNRPFFDLAFIPQYVKDKETTFKLLSRLLHVPVATFEKRLQLSAGQPKFLPINLKRNLSIHEVSTIQSNRVFLPGIDTSVAPRRDYQPDTPAHLLGYLGEINKAKLEELNRHNKDNPYMMGDLVGKQGIEARWEQHLRGKRGYRMIQVDAFGRQSHLFDRDKWNLPEVPAVPGDDIILTIDAELQKVTADAFRGKYGAVVVMNPKNGQLLAMVSEPGFDPAIYQMGLSGEEWRALLSDPFHPFLDKTTGGEFPPGSTYKAVVAMAGLEEKIIDPNSRFFCPGHFTIGNQVFHCHVREGHGLVNLREALMRSCDVFFYHVGVELGVDRIAKYARALGLGQRLGLTLNMERPGLVPTTAWKKLTHRLPWAPGETPPIAIGQGYNLLTPVQMASLYATIANGGNIWKPQIVDRVVSHVGKKILEESPQLIRTVPYISPETYAAVREGLEAVVMDEHGTGKKARVEGIRVAGKTGSVQVVSLKKNHNQRDVSMKWKEHALFAAFAPAENAEIVVAVVSENDSVGGGGASAAPVAGKILNAYWQLKKQRETLAADATKAKLDMPDMLDMKDSKNAEVTENKKRL
jgi:penicillin-binding protein 2